MASSNSSSSGFIESGVSPRRLSPLSRISFEFGWNNGDFSDVELVVDVLAETGQKRKQPESVFVNRFFLAAQSQFFKDLLADPNIKQHQIEVDAEDQQPFINMIYAVFHGSFRNEETSCIVKVLRLCAKYGLNFIAEMCNEKLVNIPTVTDAITYFQAISFDPKIQSEAVFKVARAKLKEYYRYVDQHISKYCSKKKTKNSFVDLPENAMVELCKSSKLIVTSERAVYQFALIWTQQKRNRKSCKVLLQKSITR
eukprot:TRINITY_DN2475_c0_g1_i4.p1 TRINITY_DN2475_c0_g1~~TRINITY_DN2475_c0_g1_i4.p1  ORF type:complete len:254 (-),score=47.33 TRINITY_DN2475_c0_g1_i4:590-1351(-)